MYHPPPPQLYFILMYLLYDFVTFILFNHVMLLFIYYIYLWSDQINLFLNFV